MKDAAFQCRNHVWVKGFTILGNPDDDDADTDVDDVYDEPIVMMTTMMLMWRGYVGYAALIS